jgi:hypothetical protein
MMYLNAQAYGHAQSGPPPMDKSAFKARRRMQSEYLYQDFLEFIQAPILEDLLSAKAAAGRAKDFNDIRHLKK